MVKGRSVSAGPASRVEEERVVLRVEDRVEERVVDRVAEEESSLGVVLLPVSPARGSEGGFCTRRCFLGLVSSLFEVPEVLLRGMAKVKETAAAATTTLFTSVEM